MSPLNVLGRSGVPKTSHVMKYAGRGGVEFRVCRAVIISVVPASTEGCRGWASNYMVVNVGFQRALLDTACIHPLIALTIGSLLWMPIGLILWVMSGWYFCKTKTYSFNHVRA